MGRDSQGTQHGRDRRHPAPQALGAGKALAGPGPRPHPRAHAGWGAVSAVASARLLFHAPGPAPALILGAPRHPHPAVPRELPPQQAGPPLAWSLPTHQVVAEPRGAAAPGSPPLPSPAPAPLSPAPAGGDGDLEARDRPRPRGPRRGPGADLHSRAPQQWRPPCPALGLAVSLQDGASLQGRVLPQQTPDPGRGGGPTGLPRPRRPHPWGAGPAAPASPGPDAQPGPRAGRGSSPQGARGDGGGRSGPAPEPLEVTGPGTGEPPPRPLAHRARQLALCRPRLTLRMRPLRVPTNTTVRPR